jgi:sRNA-binding carbon storage regulator CsrA
MLVIRRNIGEKVVIFSKDGDRLEVAIDRRVRNSFNLAFEGDRDAFRIYREELAPSVDGVSPAEAATGSEEGE